MKKVLIIIIILCLSLLICVPVSASTSFAVYSEKPVYGINFDYNDAEIKFDLIKVNKMKIFHIGIEEQQLVDVKDGYLPKVDMNNKGLFISTQVLIHPSRFLIDQTAKRYEMGALAPDAIRQFGYLDEILQFIDNKTLICTNTSLHALVADVTGKAAIIETGDKNTVTETGCGFIVMTGASAGKNTANDGNSDEKIEKDTYDNAFTYIRDKKQGFSIDKGFEVLKNTVQSWKGGGTLCSMIFDPVDCEVFIALNGDFSKIWKASLNNETIETWKGFKNKTRINLGNGVTAGELLHPKTYFERYGLYYAVLVLVILITTCLFIWRRNKKRKFKLKQMEW